MAVFEKIDFTLKNGKAVTIRSLIGSDAAAFLKFRRQISEETINTFHYSGMRLPTLEETAQRLTDHALDKFTLNIGVFHNEEIIGYLSMRKPYPDHPWYQHLSEFGMMLFAEYYGQGLGKKLLEIQDSYALQNGITRIQATVRSMNERGIHLYLNAGFKIEGTLKNEAFIDGKYTDVLAIAKLYI